MEALLPREADQPQPQAQSSVPHNIVHGTHAQLIFFLAVNVFTSHLGLPLLLLVIARRKIQRHGTFVNIIVAFMVMGFASSLLLYAGNITGPEPPKLLCLFQASLLYGYPALTSMSAFMLVLQMFFVIRASYQGQEMLDRDHTLRLWTMLMLPWFTFFISVLATAVIGSQNTDKISRNRRFFYCSVEALPLTNLIMTFAAFILICTFIIEVWTMYILYKRWSALRRQGSKLRWSMELNLPVRVLAFGLMIIFALSLSLLSIKTPETPVPDLAITCTALFIVIVFGTQTDVLRALCFWRKLPPRATLPIAYAKSLSTDAASDSSSQSSIDSRTWSWAPKFNNPV
ncbi:hypothetical protein BDN72DRAFT_257280 [Pluteus cervinus]|uniref:Uncharacterized protein n=1 Tax=Pluteus cervinus TaxID=181527 RepID=A0ACD3B558_9AGAR|nr:hypothetical protein BDN72DRAFT_257280 [Pluteus cervinus]